jgi:hypothetical protein
MPKGIATASRLTSARAEGAAPIIVFISLFMVVFPSLFLLIRLSLKQTRKGGENDHRISENFPAGFSPVEKYFTVIGYEVLLSPCPPPPGKT